MLNAAGESTLGNGFLSCTSMFGVSLRAYSACYENKPSVAGATAILAIFATDDV